MLHTRTSCGFLTFASCAYEYDSAYQLTKDTRTGGDSYTDTFQYDSAGNRTKKVKDAATTNYYYDYIDRMTKVGTAPLGWDYWGNMTSWWSHTMEWDEVDRLTKYDRNGSTEYDTDYAYLPGTWKRYKRVQDGTTEYFIFDRDNVIGSYTSGGTLNARYITPGLDTNLAVTQSGGTYYYMRDGLGSVRNIVDASETVQNTYDYTAYGAAFDVTEGVTSPYRYTGREYEPGGLSQMHYYRNRYYFPGIGIFASRDAMWADIHQGWGYVNNIPTEFVDPAGLMSRQEEEEWLRRQGLDVPNNGDDTRAAQSYAEYDSQVAEWLRAGAGFGEYAFCMAMCLSGLDLLIPNHFVPDSEPGGPSAAPVVSHGVDLTKRWMAHLERTAPERAVNQAILNEPDGLIRNTKRFFRHHKEMNKVLEEIGQKHLTINGEFAGGAADSLGKLGKTFKALAIFLCHLQCTEDYMCPWKREGN